MTKANTTKPTIKFGCTGRYLDKIAGYFVNVERTVQVLPDGNEKSSLLWTIRTEKGLNVMHKSPDPLTDLRLVDENGEEVSPVGDDLTELIDWTKPVKFWWSPITDDAGEPVVGASGRPVNGWHGIAFVDENAIAEQ